MFILMVLHKCVTVIFTSTEDNFRVVNVSSDAANGSLIEKMILDAVGVDVNWISISDEAALGRFLKAGIPQEDVRLLVNLLSNDKYHEM